MAALSGCAGSRNLVSPPSPVSTAGVLFADTVWSGSVEVGDDLLVPRGVTLTIRPGTVVAVRRADTSRTEPEFLDNATEIVIRGTLDVEGTAAGTIRFEPLPDENGDGGEGRAWGGIIFDGGGGTIRHALIAGAENGIVFIGASPSIANTVLREVRRGLMIHGGSAPRIESSAIHSEDGAVYCWSGSSPVLRNVEAYSAESEGLLVAPGADPDIRASQFQGFLVDRLDGRDSGLRAGTGDEMLPEAPAADFRVARAGAGRVVKEYRGENFVGMDETWEGDVLIDGTVMVSPAAVLTIAPGTVVRFAFRDTNGDGIGESELFIQGRLAAGGTREDPVVFTAGGEQGPGRWGAVNILGSDVEENVLSWVVIESSYRGLHSHFSNFRVEHGLFRRNFRGLQFQESRAVIEKCLITGNGSSLRFRDSTVSIDGVRITENTIGLQTLRSQLSLTGSTIDGNVLAGLHLRETEGVLSGNRVVGNTPGLRASGSRFLLERNIITANGYGGLQLRESEVELNGNDISGNVGNGIFVDSPAVVLRRNRIAGNLRYAVENNGPGSVDAALNWWGEGVTDLAPLLFDTEDDPALGPILTEPRLEGRPESP